jgi:hypothetical protein
MEYRRGTILVRDFVEDPAKLAKFLEIQAKNPEKKLSEPKKTRTIIKVYDDMIKGDFWQTRFPEIFTRI